MAKVKTEFVLAQKIPFFVTVVCFAVRQVCMCVKELYINNTG